MMVMMTATGIASPDRPRIDRRRVDLPAQLRVGEDAYPCRVTSLSSEGVELDVGDAAAAEVALAPEGVVVIPSLGQYKARRLRRSRAGAAYVFELTTFSRRALDALIADRFPD